MMNEGCPQDEIRRLVHEYLADVFRYARRLCRQPADAEDLVQQTFLSAQQKLDQLREPDKARAWLLAIARNCFLKTCVKRRPYTASSLDLKLDDVPVPAGDVPIDSECLQEAIQELPGDFRVVVLMFYFEYLSYRQIAEELEIPIGTVMSRLCRAKMHLRKRLSADDGPSPKLSPNPAVSWPAETLPAPEDSRV